MSETFLAFVLGCATIASFQRATRAYRAHERHRLMRRQRDASRLGMSRLVEQDERFRRWADERADVRRRLGGSS